MTIYYPTACRTESERILDEEDTKLKQQEADAKAKEDEKEPVTVEPIYKYEPKTVTDWAVQNDNKPLWTRSPREVRPMGCSYWH